MCAGPPGSRDQVPGLVLLARWTFLFSFRCGRTCGFAGVGSSVWCTTAGLVCAMDMFTQGLAHFANARRWLTEREQRGKQSPLSAPSLLRPAAPCQPVSPVPDVRHGVLGSCRRAVAAVWAREFFLFWVARTQTTSDHDQTHTVCFSLGVQSVVSVASYTKLYIHVGLPREVHRLWRDVVPFQLQGSSLWPYHPRSMLQRRSTRTWQRGGSSVKDVAQNMRGDQS